MPLLRMAAVPARLLYFFVTGAGASPGHKEMDLSLGIDTRKITAIPVKIVDPAVEHVSTWACC